MLGKPSTKRATTLLKIHLITLKPSGVATSYLAEDTFAPGGWVSQLPCWEAGFQGLLCTQCLAATRDSN